MNFKKLSVLAVAVASFGAHAAGTTLIADVTDLTIATNKGALVNAAVVDTSVLPSTGNASYILQDAGLTGAVAYISQNGGSGNANYTAIMQSDDQALAMVYQTGDNNKAVISSKFGTAGSGDTQTRTGVDTAVVDLTSVLSEAANELAATPASGILSDISNVALIAQAGTGGANTAYVDITGNNNFVAIAQTAASAANLAVVAQVGTHNRAVIAQTN